MRGLAELSDPKEIEDTVSQINSLINSGWNLLDDSQKGRLQNPMLEYLDEVEALATERLAQGLGEITGEVDISFEAALERFSETISGLDRSFLQASETQAEAGRQQAAAAARMEAAAASINAAARAIPTQITVKQRSSEVS